MDFDPFIMLMDFAWMSLLLFSGQVLRSRWKLLQNLYLPASLIGGLLGLLLGPQILGIIPFSPYMDDYSFVLVVLLFASIPIGRQGKESPKTILDKVGDTFTLNLAAEVGNYAVACLLGGAIIMAFFPEVPLPFPILMSAGFSGGHSSSAAIGGIFEEIMGWDDAVPIGQTFATIGLLLGIFVGMVIVNLGTRLGATRFVQKAGDLPQDMKTGMISTENQSLSCKNTTSAVSIETFTWHLSLVLLVTGAGYYLTDILDAMVPGVSFPTICVTMIFGVFFQKMLGITKYDKYVDNEIITKIGNTITDYLVGFGIASVSMEVIQANWQLLLILSIIGTLYAIFLVFIVSRYLYSTFWFERGLFIYGWSMGVIATGVTLLRIIDPDNKSKTLDDYGVAYIMISFLEIILLTFMPIAAAHGFTMEIGAVMMAITIGLWIFTAKKYGIHKQKVNQIRPGEAEVINS